MQWGVFAPKKRDYNSNRAGCIDQRAKRLEKFPVRIGIPTAWRRRRYGRRTPLRRRAAALRENVQAPAAADPHVDPPRTHRGRLVPTGPAPHAAVSADIRRSPTLPSSASPPGCTRTCRSRCSARAALGSTPAWPPPFRVRSTISSTRSCRIQPILTRSGNGTPPTVE